MGIRTRPCRFRAALLGAVLLPLGIVTAAEPTVQSGRAVASATTPALRELLARVAGPDASAAPVENVRAKSGAATAAMPDPVVSFEGLGSIDNVNAGLGTLVNSYDNGDIGPAHYVQVTHLLVRIYDRTGTPLVPAFRMSTLFASLGVGNRCSAEDFGNPIALYDHLADRWLLSQPASSGNLAAPYHQCVAISATPDPTGAWLVYDFLVPDNLYVDFPRFGLSGNAYLMSGQMYSPPAFSFAAVGMFALDRSRMLAGDPGAGWIYFNSQRIPFGMRWAWPADLDGAPPPTPRPGLFVMLTASEYGDASDGVRLYELTPDFSNPGASLINERPLVAVGPFDPIDPSARTDIPQPGTANRVDSATVVGPRRVQYRHEAGAERLVFSTTVDVSGDSSAAVYRAGVRSYVLRRDLPAGAWAAEEQNTFGPADGVHRWVPSAALDRFGNLAVGYNASDGVSVFPGIRYAGRLAGDMPGGLFQGETTLIAGSASQTAGNRWGEVSAMSMDPLDDCTFWYTNQYMASASPGCPAANCWHTRVGAFRFPTCSASPATGTLGGTVTSSEGGGVVAAATIETASGYATFSSAGGAYELRLFPGNYDLDITAEGYEPATVTGVNVVAGGATTRNIVLDPVLDTYFKDGFEGP